MQPGPGERPNILHSAHHARFEELAKEMVDLLEPLPAVVRFSELQQLISYLQSHCPDPPTRTTHDLDPRL